MNEDRIFLKHHISPWNHGYYEEDVTTFGSTKSYLGEVLGPKNSPQLNEYLTWIQLSNFDKENFLASWRFS